MTGGEGVLTCDPACVLRISDEDDGTGVFGTSWAFPGDPVFVELDNREGEQVW